MELFVPRHNKLFGVFALSKNTSFIRRQVQILCLELHHGLCKE